MSFSRSHLLPQSIGGFAWAWTHCKRCNEETGARIESEIVRDDSIAFAVEAVSEQLPELAAAFRARTTYVANTPHGVVRAKRKGEDYDILTTAEGDSRTSSREAAREAIRIRLVREERSDDEIAAALTLFDEAEVGIPVEIAGSTVTHG